MKTQRYQQFIERYEQFNERYTRTVGFRYSKPTIKFELETESTSKIDPKRLIEFFKNERIEHEDLIIDGDYMKVTLLLYNEKEIQSIVDKMVEKFSLRTDKINLIKID